MFLDINIVFPREAELRLVENDCRVCSIDVKGGEII